MFGFETAWAAITGKPTVKPDDNITSFTILFSILYLIAL
jgi:hypothetical protein